MYGLSFIIACCEDIYGPLLIKKKVTMGTSTHNFPLSSLISINSCSFSVVTNNKLDCTMRFLELEKFLTCLPTWHRFYPISPYALFKDGGRHRE